MIFYFTATGNSLYAARQIGGGDELVSIAQELRKTDRHYQDDAIGIVVPLFEFDLPDVVDRFIATSRSTLTTSLSSAPLACTAVVSPSA